jgi:hypothetical protein
MENPVAPAGPRGRAALAWGVALFLLAQAGLNLALHRSWSLRDPEYGRRLVALRQRLAERDSRRPLVLLLGSSRVAMNLRPGLLAVNRRGGDGPVVFNFGLCRAAPMLELHCLRRLLADGVRPDLVLGEIHYSLFCFRVAEHHAVAPERYRWPDVQALAREYADPWRLRREWLRAHAVPAHGLNSHLLAQWAPSLLDPDARRKRDEWGVDDWGWLRVSAFEEGSPITSPETRGEIYEVQASGFVPSAINFPVSDHTRRMVADLTDLCRREGIRFAFLLAPDAFLVRYPPAADRHLDAEYGRLCRDCRAPMIDLRHAGLVEDFVDGVHLTHEGAARATRVFEDEVVPNLAAGALEQRWPAGEAPPCSSARISSWSSSRSSSWRTGSHRGRASASGCSWRRASTSTPAGTSGWR